MRSVPCVDRLEVDDRTLLLFPTRLLELSDLALTAYDAAREGITPEDLARHLVEHFGSPPGDDPAAAVAGLLAELRELGVLEPENPPSDSARSVSVTPPVRVPRVLLPRPGVDVRRWATIACDQFTSQPEYWEQVEATVGDAPSSLRVVLPELHLGAPDVAERIDACRATMDTYLAEGLFDTHDALVHVERQVSDGLRRGLLVELDLEAYDFSPHARTPVRATEGTVLDRLPPRMAVRRGAALELPHILVLYDDPEDAVQAPLIAARDDLALAYDVDLMLDSGHLTGRLVTDAALQERVLEALASLVEPDAYTARYGLPATDPLLFAMGDGNHSLATAKAIWDELKASGAPEDHPARWALVELVNLHDPSLVFEPIHRVLFGGADAVGDLVDALGASSRPAASPQEVLAALSAPGPQRFGIVTASGSAVVEISRPSHEMAVGSLQAALDAWLADHPEADLDYVHGDDVTASLGQQGDNVGFLLPPVSKDAFFRSIAVDGPMPRKTFSLGHARDKRFYLEARAIR